MSGVCVKKSCKKYGVVQGGVTRGSRSACMFCEKPLASPKSEKAKSAIKNKKKMKPKPKPKVDLKMRKQKLKQAAKAAKQRVEHIKEIGAYEGAIIDQYPRLSNIKPKDIGKDKLLMVPMGCCGFLWNPMGSGEESFIRYLGTTGLGPCVAFCLYDIGTGVSLVSHFESTSLHAGNHNCFSVAVELAVWFLEKVWKIDPVSYFRCGIVLGQGPDKTSVQIVERLEAIYKLTAREKEVENSELIVKVADGGTLLLDTWLGDLYNVTDADFRNLRLGDYKDQVEDFNQWIHANGKYGTLVNLEVPPTRTEEYPCRDYQKKGP